MISKKKSKRKFCKMNNANWKKRKKCAIQKSEIEKRRLEEKRPIEDSRKTKKVSRRT